MLETILTDPASWLTLPTGLTVLAVILIYLIQKGSRTENKNLPPGPRPWPVIGNLPTLMRGGDRTYKMMANMSKEYGDILLVHMGSMRAVVINDIGNTREALMHQSDDFAGRPDFKGKQEMFDLFGGGTDIAMSPPDRKWKLMRKLTHTAIRNYAGGKALETLVHSSIDKTFAEMDKEKEAFDPGDHMNLIVVNIIAGALFGKSFELDDPYFMGLKDQTKQFLESFGNGPASEYLPFLEYVPYLNSKPFIKKMLEIMKPMADVISTGVKDHKAKFQYNSINDLTDHMLKVHQDALADEDAELLRDITSDSNLNLIFLDVFSAAVETTAYSLLWTIALLAQNPDAQKRLQDEIDTVLGDRLPELSDKPNMPYYEATSREVLRRGGTLPFVIVSTTRDTKLGGYDIPKDMLVMVNVWAIHNNPKDWPEPEKFQPKRFLDDKGQVSDKRFSYMPFSAGRRNCLGESLAKSYLFLTICRLFQKYTFAPPEGTNLTMELQNSDLVIVPKEFKILAKLRK